MNNSKNFRRDKIVVRGARVNNLKNINVEIPRDKFVVVTGLSGSGKSSLVFDAIYAESNRRFIESLSSAYVRNFLDVLNKPDVDRIENLSPSISIDQRSISRSPRSTVGTLTEIYDYLRVLYAKIGIPHCPECGTPMNRQSTKEMLEEIKCLPENSQLAVLSKPERKNYTNKEILRQIQQKGHARVKFNGRIIAVSEALLIASDAFPLDIKIVIDRIVLGKNNPDWERIADSLETALKIGRGSAIVEVEGKERVFNRDYVCSQCQMRIGEITPRHFSFNNPEGACPTCSGLGYVQSIVPELVMPNLNLSLAEGAIKPWSKIGGKPDFSSSYLVILETLNKKYGLPIHIPVKKLTSEQLSLILYGNKKQNENPNISGDGKNLNVNFFEGVIPSLERKFLETKSDFTRSEIEKYMIVKTCSSCQGKRLKKEFLSVTVNDLSIDEMAGVSVIALKQFLSGFESWKLGNLQKKATEGIIKEILQRLEALENVGLEYLTQSRGAQSISGGEAQRIRLAVQLSSRLMGITYVLDEPSIGLHCRDAEKLVKTIKTLRLAGNSVIVVEHDEKIIRNADWIIDMGPGAGEEGGQIIFEGPLSKLLKAKTLTAEYFSGKRQVWEKNCKRTKKTQCLEIVKAAENNLKEINVKIPLEKLVVICGVSGSGKSSFVDNILSRALARYFYKAKDEPGKHKKINGIEHIDKVISVDQSPIGRTPRSSAATYTGIFSHIREIFASVAEARSRGYQASHFSFNVRGGRCEVCQGDGLQKVEMHLLPDFYVKCEACGGTRYNKKMLEIEFKGHNIAQILEMNVSKALGFFSAYPLIYEKLKVMEEVGLGYLKLGQSANNLSGGEAQRIKLATELARKATGKTLYVLDEPTIGLHFDDIRRLMKVLQILVDKGNSVLVVEHNLDVIRQADWVIELGPEGGEKGGYLVYEGLPEKMSKCKKSWTAKYLFNLA